MKIQRIALLSATAVSLAAVNPAWADAPALDWQRTPVEGASVLPGTAPGGDAALRVRAGVNGRTVRLAVIDRPAIEGDVYALVGQVRYARVEGTGYLELWSVFPDGARYFSRTLAASGPLARLSGDSAWRRFELPFILDGAPSPKRLELNLVLPGRGTVWLGPVELTSGASVAVTSDAWWGSRTAGRLGGLGGLLLGLVGAAIGFLAGRGRGRGIVLALGWATIAAGAAAAVLTVVALLDSQPRVVWFPLALFASVAIVFALLMPSLKQRFHALELRRIQSADLGRGA